MIPETYDRIKNSERAVSPVIGVILMVAITVILAAVIAAFVLGFGADQDSAPQASWGVSEEDNDDVSIIFTHEGGDSVDPSQLAITQAGETIASVGFAEGNDTMTAGSSVSAQLNEEDGTVRLIWHQDGGDDTSVLRTYEYRTDE